MKNMIYRLVIACLLTGVFFQGQSQEVMNPYAPFFEEAYQKYASIPKGVLEAIAYTRTRIRHISPEPSCVDVPRTYGVMGLVEDGLGYFENTLGKVAELSGYAVEDIKRDPRVNILAFAAAYAQLQSQQVTSRSVTAHGSVLAELSEIPNDDEVPNQYAHDQEFYAVLREMQNPHTGQQARSRQVIDYEAIFGKENYQVLSSSWVNLSKTRARSINGVEYRSPACSSTSGKPDYQGALWKKANDANYGSRSGSPVSSIAIHTIQGSYSSAISWFQNPRARVSAHYIIRAFDGQVTQMVCEEEKAYHVKTDNATAIGIEHEGYVDDGLVWYTTAMYESSAALVRDICARRGFNPLQTFAGPPTLGIRTLSSCYVVKGHQHYRNNNHLDPGPYWDWERFYRLINPDVVPTTLTAATGTLTDPGGPSGNYPDLNRTAWLIKPAEKGSILLKFTQFDLESSSEGPFDYLDIYDGENANGRYLGRFSGNKLPEEILIQTGAAFLEFRSDCQVSRPGFSLQWKSRPFNGPCTPPTDLLTTDIFALGATLTWKTNEAADRYVVMIKRRAFETAWTRYVVRENFLTVSGLAANGFYEWQVMAVCGADTSARAGSALVTPGVSRSGVPAVYTVRSRTGFFYDSGGRQAGYAPDESFLYRILPEGGGQVELTFASFETEEGKDILKIYDGTSSSGKLLGTFSGRNSPGKITSTQGALTLQFNADKRTEASGWISQWRTTGNEPTPVTTPSVVVTPDPPVKDPTTKPQPPVTTPPVTTPPPVVVIPDAADGGLVSKPYLHPVAAPRTQPALAATPYNSTFNAKFEDRDRSGKGLANRFYTVALNEGRGYVANNRAGFFYDDFNNGLQPYWKQATGTWSGTGSRVVQTDASNGNTNLWTDLRQTNQTTYLYQWKARMTGNSGNLRTGIHFFCTKAGNPNRGNSYFVWVRDGADGDMIEIYKTVDDKFDRKARETISLTTGQVYDYKVILNPQRGRIEVYLDNRFVVAWDDPYPLWTGSGISLRSSDCVAEFDDVRVYQSRDNAEARISVGSGEFNLLRTNGQFLVSSLVVDRNINWSANTADTAKVSFAGGGTASVDPEPATPTGLQPSYKGSFLYMLPAAGAAQRFFLPLGFEGNTWKTPLRSGRYYDDFEGNALSLGWEAARGTWKQQNGSVEQTNTQEDNGNLFSPLAQTGNDAYLYHFKAKLDRDGENARFGLHLLASEGRSDQRGNSYLVWFRRVKGGQDQVEVYRMENNRLSKFKLAKYISLPPDTWHDVKITFDPLSGTLSAWLNNKLVLSWKDDKTPFTNGSYLSLRTGNAHIMFDELRVYRAGTGSSIQVTVGNSGKEMIQAPGAGSQVPVKLMTLGREQNDTWTNVQEAQTVIR